MTNPRRPDDPRISTADLAAAGERAAERPADRNAGQRPVQPMQPAQPAQPVQPAAARQPAERDVTRDQHAHANMVADAPAHRPAADNDHSTPLFAGNEADDFRHRWSDIQTGFVDEPRQAVERADALVASAIKRLAEVFAHERATLEQQWSRGNDVSTEDLRVALRRYRGFFDRLLSV